MGEDGLKETGCEELEVTGVLGNGDSRGVQSSRAWSPGCSLRVLPGLKSLVEAGIPLEMRTGKGQEGLLG